VEAAYPESEQEGKEKKMQKKTSGRRHLCWREKVIPWIGIAITHIPPSNSKQRHHPSEGEMRMPPLSIRVGKKRKIWGGETGKRGGGSRDKRKLPTKEEEHEG